MWLGTNRAERGLDNGVRIPAIDVVKGLAILGVIAQHALTRGTMDDMGADLVPPGRASPVRADGVRRRSLEPPPPGATLAEAYGARYWRGRFRRILLPLPVVFAVALVAGAATGRLQVGPLTLVGYCRCPARVPTGSRSCSPSR